MNKLHIYYIYIAQQEEHTNAITPINMSKFPNQAEWNKPDTKNALDSTYIEFKKLEI